MKVAVVNETLPYPPTAGNRIRTLNLIQRMARRHQVTYISRASDNAEETRIGIEYLHKQGIRTIIADWAPRVNKGLAFYSRLAGNLFSPVPYAVASHNSPRLRQSIRRMANDLKFDLWQFEWLAYADAVADIPGARTLVMAHNVESLIWKRYWQNETSPLKRMYLREQYRKFRNFEGRVFAQVGGVVCVSDEDARLAANGFFPRRLWVVDNGIDPAYFRQATGQRSPRTVLFLGSLEWRPNLDAVKLLLDRIYPRLRELMPDVRLQIVGRRPPQWLTDRVAQLPDVDLFADVADVRPYLASAGVMAVPLRVGGGSRLKILEAMACALPVVSTAVGCEGLALRHNQELIVADDPEQFAQSLCQTLQEPRRAGAMAEAGRKLVCERYDWDVLAYRLEEVWEQAARAPIGKPAPAMTRVQPAMG